MIIAIDVSITFILSNFNYTCQLVDNDEPLLSGSGAVSKDVTDEELLENWAEVSFTFIFIRTSQGFETKYPVRRCWIMQGV